MSSYPDGWEEQLAGGCQELGLTQSAEQSVKLLDYLVLLMKWNKAYNLTAIRNPKEMVPRQLLDSLSILHLVQGTRILDMGTGAGLPGIPLAICLPETKFVLMDSNGKKTRFVQQAKLELDLHNLEVMQSRAEDFSDEQGFDTITTRAFAALPKILDLGKGLLVQGGVLLAMKGVLPSEEIEQLSASGIKVNTERLDVPNSGERHAILIQP